MVCCQERGWHNRRRPHLFDPFESSTLLIQLGGGGNPLVVEKWCLSFSNECDSKHTTDNDQNFDIISYVRM